MQIYSKNKAMFLFQKISLRLSQVTSFIYETKRPLPLILDLLKLKSDSYIAESKEGYKTLIRPKTGERFAFYENIIRKDYIKNGVQLGLGDIVIDIGANIGCFTILAASLVGKEGKVVAIEPDPLTYKQLCENIALNQLSNVIALNIAVSDKNKMISLNVSPNSLYTSIYSKVDSHQVKGKTIQVSSSSLVNLLDELEISQVKLLKMDCEGAEYKILDSLTSSLASRIEQISMEVHQISGHQPEELTVQLKNLGCSVNPQYPLFAYR